MALDAQPLTPEAPPATRSTGTAARRRGRRARVGQSPRAAARRRFDEPDLAAAVRELRASWRGRARS